MYTVLHECRFDCLSSFQYNKAICLDELVDEAKRQLKGRVLSVIERERTGVIKNID